MHMLLRLFCVGDSIPCGFSKKSQIIKGNRASFESFWLSYSLFCFDFMVAIEPAFIHTNIKLFGHHSDFLTILIYLLIVLSDKHLFFFFIEVKTYNLNQQQLTSNFSSSFLVLKDYFHFSGHTKV